MREILLGDEDVFVTLVNNVDLPTDGKPIKQLDYYQVKLIC